MYRSIITGWNPVTGTFGLLILTRRVLTKYVGGPPSPSFGAPMRVEERQLEAV